MNETTVQIVSLVLLLVPLPLVVYGVLEGPAILWWAGIAMAVVGGVIPPLTRYLFPDDEEEEEETAENGSETETDENASSDDPEDGH